MQERLEHRERRGASRCTKDIGMRCALLNDSVDQPVMIRNYSTDGIYFASERAFQPGSWVVLRSALGREIGAYGPDRRVPEYTLTDTDPAVCAAFRSHTVARVLRCEPIGAGGDDKARYGIGVRIQWLTD